MNKDPGPWSALGAAIIVAAAYTQGGIFTAAASLIILAVLITPVAGQPALLTGLFNEVGMILRKGIGGG